MRRLIVLAVSVVAGVAMLSACTITGDGPALTDDNLGERIVDPFDLAAEEIAALPGVPGGQIADDLDAAVADRDTCALLLAMDLDLPDTDDPEGAIEAYDALARAANAAESFIPDEIASYWPSIMEMSERGADAVTRTRGDLTHPSVAPIFTSAESQDAVAGIGRYRDAECEDVADVAATTTTAVDVTTTSGAP